MNDYSFVEVVNNRNRLCHYYKLRNGGMCHGCPLSATNTHSHLSCFELSTVRPKEYLDIVMQWAKEHPIKTNADKFKEVFGFKIEYINKCKLVLEDKGCNNPRGRCESCENSMTKFWQQEYKE